MINDFSNIVFEELSNKRILVVGDVMLDQYYFGTINRISPEAPVPIVKVDNTNVVLGGAGNVANNLAKMGCKTYIVGTSGNDDNRNILCRLFEKKNINYEGIFITDKPTITKTRVVGLNQQILRIDFENDSEISNTIINKIKDYISFLVDKKGIDIIIISDYNKGLITEDLCQSIISIGNKKKITVIVDPKGSNWSKYKDADFVTPNVKELSDVCNNKILNDNEEVSKFGIQAKLKYKIKNLLVTRSDKGMTLLTDNHIEHFSTVSKEVYDVSGAGDTVVATLAAMLSINLYYKLAVQIANIAAGIAVSHRGTYAVDTEEIRDAININKVCNLNKKLIAYNHIEELVIKLKHDGKKIVFTNGCFDILHIGHVTYLEKARELGDVLILGLNSDDSVKRLKGDTRPINNENDRAKILAALSVVDYIVIFCDDTPKNLISKVEPDYLVKGSDYEINQVVGKEYSKEVILIDFERGYSTTNIIKKINGVGY